MKAIRRIWREEGLLKVKRRKHKTKQNLRAEKAKMPVGRQFCVDTKDLDDIPELWPQIQRFNLPLVQYTVREVVSGLQYVAYARERSLCYATLFIARLRAHLQACGRPLDGAFIQTDNGSSSSAPGMPAPTASSLKPSATCPDSPTAPSRRARGESGVDVEHV